MEKLYDVTFSYTINVYAENKEDAEALAMNRWDEIVPRTDEMNVDGVEVVEDKE